MSDEGDPTRLADGSGDDFLRDALREARSDVPGARAVASMWSRFPVPGGGGGGPSGAPKPGPGPAAPPAPLAGAGAGAASKVIVGVVLAGAIGVGAVGGYRALNRPARPPAPSAWSAPTASTPGSVASVEAHSDALATPPSTSAASAAEAHGRPGVAPSASSTSTTESALLTEAHAALGSNPSHALELVAEHRARFPKGQMGLERDMIEIQALEALGKTDEARARADAFRKRHPDSPFGPRLDEMFPR